MSNSDDAFKMLAGKAITEGINSTNEKNKAAETRMFLALVGILFFVGNDAVQIVFRKNYGVGVMDIVRLVILFLVFLLFGAGFISFYLDDSDTQVSYASASSFIVTGILYVVLAFYILFVGSKKWKGSRKATIHPDDEGESSLLSFLVENYGWKQKTLKYAVEPFYVLFLAGLYAFYNPVGAIPIAICAFSVWAYPVVKLFFPANLQSNLQNYRQPPSTGFNRVN